MRRSEYIVTREGQAHEKFKRSLDKIYLQIQQEPKSKNGISLDEKKEFRERVRQLLKKQKRRAFRSDIILEIDFQTKQDNPPALHTLTKNYLDLLHKPMPDVDSNKEILFKDDSQIKTLIANYHLNTFINKKPEIRIRAYRFSHFIKDIELAGRIRHDRFEDDSGFSYRYRRYDDFEEEEYIRFNDDYYDDLLELEKDKDWYIEKSGVSFYTLQKQYLQRRIQEQFLQQNNISINNLISLFQASFNYNNKYSFDKKFQKLWELTANLISVSTNSIELGGAPYQKGDTRIFKSNLEKKLKEFKSKYRILFPLLQPISVTVFYTPPIQNVLDLDNLARYIVPLLTEIFEPPAILELAYDSKFLNDSLKREVSILQRFPKNGIANYQLIYRPRAEDTPDEGIINFYITDGMFLNNNIWRTIDRFIDKWED